MDNNKVKGILLLGDENSIIQQYGSKVDTITSRDSLLIKVYKTFAKDSISSSIKNTLFVENSNVIDWIIVFEEAIEDEKDILLFCKENNLNLLFLKEEIKLSGQYNFKIIHSPNIRTASEIYETIMSQKEKSMQ